MNLPTPDPAFRWSVEPWGDALRCVPLESVAQHLFTTRQLQLHPSTLRPFGQLTVAPNPVEGQGPLGRAGQHRGTRASGRQDAEGSLPDPQHVAWTQATASLGAGIEQLMRIRQVHGRTVRVLRKGEIGPQEVQSRPDADAIVSNQADLVLAVQVADCVPLLMADRRSGAAAAVHAGWRGTCAGIALAAIEAMAREFGTRPHDLAVAMGPSIGACCYEVGPELVDAFRAAGSDDAQLAQWFERTPTGALRLDLWVANRDQIRATGVPEGAIYLSRLCTQSYLGVFDSFRAEGARAGRMAALIRVPGGR